MIRLKLKNPVIMRFTSIAIPVIIFLFSCSNNNNKARRNSTNDSLSLIKMIHARVEAMRYKNINTVMAQFSEDATFINGEGYYLGNKAEIAAFHKGLTQSDAINYHYTAGNIHVRILDEKNALVYYPNRMDWYRVSNPKDTIEKETRLLTLSAQKRNGKWLWIAITNQQTKEYFEDLTKHRIKDLYEYFKDTMQTK